MKMLATHKKKDIIVQKAKTTINDLGLINRNSYLKAYRNINRTEWYNENYLRKYILQLAEDQTQMNYLFVEKVLKQINLLLL